MKADWWNKAWIPFLESPGRDYWCIDLDPVQASSLTALFEQFASELQNGDYEIDDEDGSLTIER